MPGQQRDDVGEIRNHEALAPRLRHNRLEKNRTKTGVMSTDDVPAVVVADEECLLRRHVKQRQGSIKRRAMRFPPPDVHAEHRRIDLVEEPVASQLSAPRAGWT